MRRFTPWARWVEREMLAGLGVPGVYVIAKSDHDIAGRRFDWLPEIIYIGMTNGVSGLKGRLAQFDDTIADRRLRHGGADRVRFRYRSYQRLVPRLYISVASIACDPATNLPTDLRRMGEVARLEFHCLAEYAE